MKATGRTTTREGSLLLPRREHLRRALGPLASAVVTANTPIICSAMKEVQGQTESYEGGYRKGLRHGFGVYTYSNMATTSSLNKRKVLYLKIAENGVTIP